jgi:hypothetical protein
VRSLERQVLPFFFPGVVQGAAAGPPHCGSPDVKASVYRGFNLVPKLEWTVPLPGDLGLAEHLELWDELEDRIAAAQGYESPRTY